MSGMTIGLTMFAILMMLLVLRVHIGIAMFPGRRRRLCRDDWR